LGLAANLDGFLMTMAANGQRTRRMLRRRESQPVRHGFRRLVILMLWRGRREGGLLESGFPTEELEDSTPHPPELRIDRLLFPGK
jgi:hypothetical protein